MPLSLSLSRLSLSLSFVYPLRGFGSGKLIPSWAAEKQTSGLFLEPVDDVVPAVAWRLARANVRDSSACCSQVNQKISNPRRGPWRWATAEVGNMIASGHVKIMGHRNLINIHSGLATGYQKWTMISWSPSGRIWANLTNGRRKEWYDEW